VDLGAGGSVRLRAETTASLDPWQHLLLLAVPGGTPVRYVYLCWCISGGRWRGGGDEDGCRSDFGVDFFDRSASSPGPADDSRIRFGFQLSCERVDVLRVSGDALFVRAVGFPCIGVFVSSVMMLLAVDYLSSSLHAAAADFLSWSTMHAGGGSRCWLLRQINATSLMEEEDGLSLVPASSAGGRVTGGGPHRRGVLVVILGCSRVFFVKLQRCTVLYD